MAYTLNPRCPILWRDTTTVQIGLDAPRVVLHDVSAGVEKLLSALRSGVADAAVPAVADLVGLPLDDCRDVLAGLEPVLVRRRPPAPPTRTVALDGDGPIADELSLLLADAGLTAVHHHADAPTAPDSVDLAVLFGDYAIAPHRYGWWLRRDIPHLAITVTDAAVRVGPFVHPGRGPCLHCVDRRATDADPCWPVLAGQLLARTPQPPSRAATLSAALAAETMILDRLAGPDDTADTAAEVAAIDPLTGAATRSRVTAHPSCLCQSLPENVTRLPDRRAATDATSSVRADAAPE